MDNPTNYKIQRLKELDIPTLSRIRIIVVGLKQLGFSESEILKIDLFVWADFANQIVEGKDIYDN